MNNELEFEFYGDGEEIYKLLINEGFDENEFEIVNEFGNNYYISFNDEFVDESELYNLLKNKFNKNITFIL